jgi:hypothetical protein
LLCCPQLRASPPEQQAEEAKAAETRSAALDDSLRARIFGDYPALTDPAASDWEKTNLLRQWAWSHTPTVAGRSGLLCCRPEWHGLSAAETFQAFEEKSGGVWCGGAATALQRLYQLFGFEAWAVNTGSLEGRGSHVVTLVRIEHRGEQRIIVQDAYFNLTFVDAETREPVEYLQLVQRLAAGDHASIAVRSPDYRDMPQWPSARVPADQRHGQSAAEIAASPCFWVMEEAFDSKLHPDGLLEFVSPRRLDKFLARRCHDAEGKTIKELAWLEEQGHPPEIIYLFLYPLGMQGPHAPEFLQQAQAAAKPLQRVAELSEQAAQ